MKIQSLFVVSIICLFCSSAFAEAPAPAEAAATGICKDGTPYTGASKRGACRGHKGVKEWFGDKAAAATSAPAAATPAVEPAKIAVPAPAPAQAAATAAATGLCKDGTEYTGATKRGACRGHKGVKEWYADKQAPAAPAPAVEPTPVPPPAPPVAAPAPTTKPAPATAPVAAVPAPAAGSGKVWVNSKSKIYHCEGSKFYGKTKDGEYMSEADALAKGVRANRNKACN